MSDLRQRVPRVECPAFLAFVRRKPCCACGAPAPSQAAHVRFSDAASGNVNPGVGAKPSDRFCVPLCAGCHLDDPGAQHRVGERKFWARVGIDPYALAATLYAQFERRQKRTPEQRKAVASRARRILRKRKPMMGPGLEAEFVKPDDAPIRKVSRSKDPELYRYRWGAGRPMQSANRWPKTGSRKIQNREKR